MSTKRNWTNLGQAKHPLDGEWGTAYYIPDTGREVMETGTGTIRSLPRNWRESQKQGLDNKRYRDQCHRQDRHYCYSRDVGEKTNVYDYYDRLCDEEEEEDTETESNSTENKEENSEMQEYR